MTQEKVIKEIENGNFYRVDGIKEIVIETLEKMKTGDLISREAVLDMLDTIESEIADGDGYQYEKWRTYVSRNGS